MAATSRDPVWLVAGFAVCVVALRLLAANFGRFTEGDEISIAAGIAALNRDVAGDFYRYGLQLGYYRLVSGVTTLLGGRLLTIPDVMTWLSVLAGSVIPVAGLLAFRRDLSRLERWFLAGTLAANPIIWLSSRYGNTALLSVALTVGAAAILSNYPKRSWEAVALGCFGLAILVRADAVLASGAIFLLLWRALGTFMAAALRLGAVAFVVAVLFGAALLLDPRMDSLTGAIAQHVANPITTRFFEFLIWAMSPIPLFFAGAGARDLQRGRGMLLAVVGAWVLPLAAFYVTNTTTARYLLQLVFPLALVAAVGMAGTIAARGRARVVSAVVVVLAASLHLFVGLSNFSPSKRRSWLTDALVRSDDGPVWTGALLYKSYVMRPLSQAPILTTPRFRASNEVERSLVQLFDTLESGSRRGRRVWLVTAGGYGNEMHYFAHVAGVTVQAQAPGMPFNREIRMEHGGAEVIGVGVPHLAAMPGAMALEPGDEVWGLHPSRAASDSAMTGRVAQGLVLRPQPEWPRAGRLWPYVVERAP